MKKLFQEFKEFAFKGNVIDMAIGVIIGGAFSTIVSSLVDDILMPLLGIVTGGTDFSALSVKLGEENFLKYGSFLNSVINFLLIAVCIFAMLKVITSVSKKMHRQKEKEAAAAPAGPTQEQLLTEIRDLLKEKNDAGNLKK